MLIDDQQVKALVALALDERVVEPFRQVVAARTSTHDVNEVYDGVAVYVARAFLDGSMPFEDADWVTNQIYGAMVQDLSEDSSKTFSRLAFAIFEAFDAGEYMRAGEDEDPAEKYTRLYLQEILSDLERSSTS